MSPYFVFHDGPGKYSVHALKPGTSGRIMMGNLNQTRAIEAVRCLNEAHAAGVHEGTHLVRSDVRKALGL
jgi:hypothetical protein